MEMLTIFARTILIYFSVLVMMRLMGKREIGKLSAFDLVISIMVAEIAVIVIEDVRKPVMAGLLPMATLVAIQILIATITLKSRTLRSWMDGRPSIIIDRGKLNRDEMAKQRYTLDDLMVQLRQNNVHHVADVEFAVLETSGKLTVMTKKQKQENLTPSLDDDWSENRIRYEGLPLPLIMDGKVQDENLQKLGKTRFWLKNQIQPRGANDFKDVFLCTIDHRGYVFVDRKKR